MHFRSRQGIDTRDNAKVGVVLGSAFETSFPVPSMKTDLHIEDGADHRVSTDPLSNVG